ncbi:cold shock protein 1-like [Vicia villosa]|uniref:cold shock protein 1-like n=1 Tax=Vicia villosa TaxID=3911 RepID=UPI00273A9884|nr:cold shock protein 1-like [Vicia villosa]
MNCTNAQKVQFGTHMLEKEVGDWWGNTVHRFDEVEDVRGKKDVEFLELKQGNETVAEIYDEDSRKSDAYYKSLNDRKGKGQFRGKSYADKGKQKTDYYMKPSGGGATILIKCFKCGVKGHRASKCTKDDRKCFKCGKMGYKANDCRVSSNVTCYNCGKRGHISTKCDKPEKEKAKGKVFALFGSESVVEDRLI